MMTVWIRANIFFHELLFELFSLPWYSRGINIRNDRKCQRQNDGNSIKHIVQLIVLALEQKTTCDSSHGKNTRDAF